MLKTPGYIELKVDIHIMWECDFDGSRNTPIARANEKVKTCKNIDPHDAFYGGRTNAVKLYNEATTNVKIAYLDIWSLYLMTLKNDEYPVGIPVVIVQPVSTGISSYFGLIQVTVSPPRKFYRVCLLYRCNQKVMVHLEGHA